MESDDADAKKSSPDLLGSGIGPNLEGLSITALETYLHNLSEETERVRQMIVLKRAARQSADAIFKS